MTELPENLEKIVKSVRERYHRAVEHFGTYTLCDKGCDAIMDMSVVVAMLDTLPASEAAIVVDALADCENLNESLVIRLDYMPETWWDEFYKASTEAKRCY